jgi:hypothetical protein
LSVSRWHGYPPSSCHRPRQYRSHTEVGLCVLPPAQTIAEEEVDARDGYKLLHRLTAVREYENPDAEPLPVAKLRMAKVVLPLGISASFIFPRLPTAVFLILLPLPSAKAINQLRLKEYRFRSTDFLINAGSFCSF